MFAERIWYDGKVLKSKLSTTKGVGGQRPWTIV